MCWDGEDPSVIKVREVVARKRHRCCECRRTILSRETYQMVDGCWDGSWDHYRTCSGCVNWRNIIGDEAGCTDDPPLTSALASGVEVLDAHIEGPGKNWNLTWCPDLWAERKAADRAARQAALEPAL